MAKQKNRASKADVQTTESNKMPAPELDTEAASESALGMKSDIASRKQSKH